jgi:amino acid adenylation domain-containing protein
VAVNAPDLLTRLAAVPADRPAVVSGDRVLTFGQLRSAAGRVARRLADRGVGAESMVGLCLPRGLDLVTGMLGTLAAGAAYLPVDPALPADRRRFLLADSAADLVVTTGPADDPAGDGPPWVPIAELTTGPSDGWRPAAVHPDNTAYVIYTSGSTGRPKGVEISRGAVAALLAALEAEGLAGPGAGRVGWNASPSFDASVQQWVRLCRGDTVVLVDEQTRTDPALLARLVDGAALTDLDITPSHLAALLDHLPNGPDPVAPLTLLVGGEAVGPALWRRIGDRVAAGTLRAANVYGPTECTVDATAGWITPGTAPHIGAALPGLRLRVLDGDLNPVTGDAVGEIYLSGARVARGYRHRPGLTAERFVATAGGGRMYRTGDRARWRPDGRLEFLGRTDGQLKLRGHRIEPGEIEGVLAEHPDVAEVVVHLRDDLPGGSGLVAYYRPARVDQAGLRLLAVDNLPGYMLPAAFVAMDRFPTTPNGKLDRAALPPPGGPTPNAAELPLGPVETLIADVWARVLQGRQIGAGDNFFKLGGHSLLAIKLVAQVRSELGVRLALRDVYANPRLRDLARHIESLLEVVPG